MKTATEKEIRKLKSLKTKQIKIMINKKIMMMKMIIKTNRKIIISAIKILKIFLNKMILESIEITSNSRLTMNWQQIKIHTIKEILFNFSNKNKIICKIRINKGNNLTL